MLDEAVRHQERQVSYIDLPMDPEFERSPAETLFPVLERHTVVKGRDGVYGGVRMPNNFLLPDQDSDLFLILGFNAVRKTLSDAASFSSALGYGETMALSLGKVLFTMDDPEHKKYRALVSQAFTHRSVTEEWLDLHVAPVISDAVAAFSHLGRGDLVQLFTLHFPFQVIGKITGVPFEHETALSELTQDALEMGKDPERSLRAFAAMNDIFQSTISARRQHPKDDLISALIAAELDGERLSDTDILSFLRNLITAGLDTTYRATSNLIYYLLSRPKQFDELKQSPELLDSAIWESLRVDAVGGYVPRVATRDAVVDDVNIPAGASVLVCQYMANYDPRIWNDPLTFDIRRERKPLMTFGAGPHSCLGNNLARAEIKMAMGTLLERLPGLRANPEQWESARIRGFGLRSVDKLPALWDAQ